MSQRTDDENQRPTGQRGGQRWAGKSGFVTGPGTESHIIGRPTKNTVNRRG